jgi:hypothetical protein
MHPGDGDSAQRAPVLAKAPRDRNLVKDNGVSVYKPEAQAREKAAASLAPRACVGNTFEQVIPARILTRTARSPVERG